MPLRRHAAVLVVLVTALLGAPPAGAIVGGGNVAITSYPYQVALVQSRPVPSSNYQDQFCGGTIRDSTHIITAAHCVYDSLTAGQVASPSKFSVLAGTATLSATSTAGRSGVRAVSVNPGYDESSLHDDSAVLTLAAPLPNDPNHAPVRLVNSSDWAGVTPSAALFVTGWGTLTEGGSRPTTLQGVGVPLVDDGTCTADYAATRPPVDGAYTVCAGSPTKDSCQGDSGGPLVHAFGPTLPNGYQLVGIVSFGVGCARPGYPGLYTEVAKASVRDYISQADPVPAPVNVTSPLLSGTAAVGSILECATGDWTESPTLSVQWVSTLNGADSALTGVGASTSYPVQIADVGSTISCIVHASNRGGDAYARSQPSSAVPQPTEPPAAPPPAPAPAQPTTPHDQARPVARILTAGCHKRTCTLKLNVSDAGFSAGISRVTGSLRSTYRRSCTRNGRRTSCVRHQTRALTATRTATNRFTIKLARLPVGTQLFTLLATDRAGHKQLLPTRRTLKTRR